MRAIASILGSLVALSSLLACGNESDGETCFAVIEPPPCESETDCPSYRCSCADDPGSELGHFSVYAQCLGGVCDDGGTAACAEECADSGGVGSVAELPNPAVTDAPECAELCALIESKAAELECGEVRCPPYSVCEISEGMCAESATAKLACLVATAEFDCVNGVLSMASDCPDEPCPSGACVRAE